MTCSAPPRYVLLSLAAALPALAGTRGAGAPAADNLDRDRPALAASAPWVEPVPSTPGEVALRAALGHADRAVEGLLRVPAVEPDSPAAGLARLAAGWRLVDDGRGAEAFALLTHPDIARTALADHARHALARALEASGERVAAARTYVGAAEASAGGPLACAASLRAGEIYSEERQPDPAVAAYEAALVACRQSGAQVLLRIAEIRDQQGDARAAAEAYDRLDREHPASPQARQSAARRRALAAHLPAPAPAERAARQARRGLSLFDARLYAEAEPELRAALDSAPDGAEKDLLRVRYGRALLARRRTAQALAVLRAVPADSPRAAEAAYARARAVRPLAARLAALERVASAHPASEWGEEALLALASHYQKDANDVEAAPYYRRLAASYPEGRYADRSAFRAGWADFSAARFASAARLFEWAARARPVTYFTPGYLYWAGRARAALRQTERARQLYDETVQRFKHTYHGLRAAEALAALPGGSSAATPALVAEGPRPRDEIPEPQLVRLRQLLLIERLDEALEELRRLPDGPAVRATIGWLEWRRGRLRPAIHAMQRAFPGYLGAAADLLPEAALRILYPLVFRDEIERAAAAAGLDPALLAALICQESTFQPDAVSPAGARGLMQIMPSTGRTLARELGVRYRRSALHDPQVSLDFGTTYLRRMLDRFGDRVEYALAAYNAGPHRVDAWTAARPERSVEQFVESIPFTETRHYVMTILATRERYRQLYDLHPAAPSLASAPSSAPAGRP